MQCNDSETSNLTIHRFAGPPTANPEPGPQSEDDNGTSDGPPDEP